MAGVVADRVVIELEAKLDKYDANVRRALDTFGKTTDGIERRASQLERVVGRAMGGVGAALAGVSAVALARTFLSLADASKSMEAQLRLATKTLGTFGQAQADVERLASDTRQGLTETTALYGNLLRATAALGGTQSDAARATETFSKALKIGGADTAEAAAATLQFGQALASGVLRGDEFNSIAEASPRILQLLADALGVPRGALRALAEQGKLTSDVLFKALTDRRFTAGIDDEFKSLPVTFSEAMQQVENAATITFGAFDRGGNFSTALANFITDGAHGFAELAGAAESEGINIRATFAGLATVFDPLVAAGKAAFANITVNADYASDSIANILRLYDKLNNSFVAIDNFGRRVDNSVKRFGNRVQERNAPNSTFRFGQTPLAQRSDQAGTFERSFDRSRAAGRADATDRKINANFGGSSFDRYVKDPSKYDIFGNARNPQRIAPPAAAGKKGPSAETLAKREEAARLTALRNDEAFESEKAGLNQDLLRARAATTNAAETVAQFELQEIEAARVRQNQSYTRDVSEKKLTQARADELVALNDQVAAARAAVVTSERDERARADRAAISEAGLEIARDAAQSEVDLANTAKERRDASLRVLDAEYRLEKAKLDAIVASEQSTAAEREIARLKLAALPGQQAAARAGVERQNEGPLARYRRGLDDPATQVEQAVADKLKSVDQGITDAVSKQLGIKDPFLKQLLQIFLQQNILKPIYDAVAGAGGAGGGGGLSGLVSTAGTFISGLFGGRASGGHVSAGRTYRVTDGEGFQPAGSGKIIPLGRMRGAGGGGGVTLHQVVNVDARGVNPDGYADHIRAAVRKDTIAIVGRAAQIQSKNAPARLQQYETDGV